MKQLTKRDFLKGLGLAAGGMAGGAAFADETVGDPFYPGFNKMIANIPHSMKDLLSR